MLVVPLVIATGTMRLPDPAPTDAAAGMAALG